jgi:hypothetical protein
MGGEDEMTELKTTIFDAAMRRGRTVVILALILFGCLSAYPQTPATDPYPGPPKVLWFNIELHRLVPDQLSIPEGKYLIRVSKGVVTSDITLELRDGASQALQSQASAKHGSALAYLPVSLHPGKYALSVPGMPKWSCNLMVTPAK